MRWPTPATHRPPAANNHVVEAPDPTTQVPSRHKVARVNGVLVDLYAEAMAYRVLGLSVATGLLTLFCAIGLMSSRNFTLAMIAFYGGQGLTGLMVGYGLYLRHTPVRLPPPASSDASPPQPAIGSPGAAHAPQAHWRWLYAFGYGLVALVPLLGILPAAQICGDIHRIFNALGLPIGHFGPTNAAIDALHLGACHRCGYDIREQASNTCPECGADVAGDKPESQSLLRLVEIDRQAASRASRSTMSVGLLGLVVGIGQFAALFAVSRPDSGALLLIWSASIPMLFLGGVIAGRGKKVLAASGTVDDLAVVLAMLIWPVLGGVLLMKMSNRLSEAANSGRNC